MNATSPATAAVFVLLVLAVIIAVAVIESRRDQPAHKIGPSSTHPFVEPVSGQAVVLRMGAAPGVEHPDCIYRAEVTPDLDCFYCAHCGWNGRISGSWFMDLLSQEDA